MHYGMVMLQAETTAAAGAEKSSAANRDSDGEPLPSLCPHAAVFVPLPLFSFGCECEYECTRCSLRALQPTGTNKRGNLL